MSDEKFERLLNGPLHHPHPIFIITRLALALRHVTESTGEAGERALEDFCAGLDARDCSEEGA